ncbi:toll/interleukin-1 receptor domain-containing protein [Dactylosporangium sp. NPDC049525]|uniref:toll/interleukin-1 receptor domain-containing protein n=1 Tax=Dactylosporangium sp. NPDC049525 TaxID=3154730 RepID=UPI00343DDD83
MGTDASPAGSERPGSAAASQPGAPAGRAVFVSYSSADSAIVMRLVQRLQELGFHVWFDSVIVPGENFSDLLRAAIENSHAVIAMMSPSYFASRWCQQELLLAFESNKRILPVLLEGEPQGPLRHLQYLRVAESDLPQRVAELLGGPK